MLTLSLLEFRNKMYANDPNYFRSQGIKDFPQNQCESEHTWSSSREPSMMCRSSGWHISILLLAHDLMVGGRRAQSPWTTGQGSFKPALTLRSRRPLDLKFRQTHTIATRWETLRTQITMIFLNCSREIWHQSKLLFVRCLKWKCFPWQGNRKYKISERLSELR